MVTDKIRTWAEIDTAAMVHNLKYGKKLVGNRKIMCVIKGDAHGHGAVRCGLALERNGVDAFAVACLTEAIELRKGGIQVPILILGWTPVEYADELAYYHIAQSALSKEYAAELNKAAENFGVTVDVHVKLDTGMSRTGIFAQDHAEDAAKAVLQIAKMTHLRIKGIFTHFAAADMPEKNDFTAWQIKNYTNVLHILQESGFREPFIRHAANSAGIMYHPEAYFDMVRMGVMMYGLYPNGVYEADGPLVQAITLKARVAQVRNLPAGAHISYGCTVELKRPSKIAVVTAGYADSYPRQLSNRKAYAVIHGEKCPQIGRVCMDMCMFDITDAKRNIKSGDEVILYGKGGMPMEEVASLVDTINCEPLCLLTNRVKKTFL